MEEKYINNVVNQGEKTPNSSKLELLRLEKEYLQTQIKLKELLIQYQKEKISVDRKIVQTHQEVAKLLQKNRELKRRYDALRFSKLGRVITFYWGLKNKIFKREITHHSKKTLDKNTNKLLLNTQKKVQELDKEKQLLNEIRVKQKIVNYNLLKEIQSDKEYFNRIKPLLDEIPESNGSRFFHKIKLSIGIICDEFLFRSFHGLVNLIYITPDNYKRYVDELDLLLVVSTYKGLNGEWEGMIDSKNEKRYLLFQIIDFYRDQKVHTVFYFNEAIDNINQFIDIAGKCNEILIDNKDKVDEIKKLCNNNNVHFWEPGVNPLYYNPIGIKKIPRKKGVLFSRLLKDKFCVLDKDMRMLFDGVLKSNYELKIVDENFLSNDPSCFFPEEYVKFISPINKSDYQLKLPKLYDWALLINLDKYSNALSSRIYEMLAQGVAVLSNYSPTINYRFPNVFTVVQKEEIIHVLNGFDEEDKYSHQVLGIRKIMSNNTAFQSIEKLLEILNFSSKTLKRSVGVVVKRKTDKLKKIFENQTYPYKELITENELDENQMKRHDMIAFFSEDKDYSPFYLEDMINAFKYTDSDYITKDAYYDGDQLISGIEHNYVNVMKDKFRTVFWSDSFTADSLLEYEGEINLTNGYSIDRFEFNNKSQYYVHKQTKQYRLSVIIPVYNNGDHLINKCFNSLKRSSIFDQMEIIIVDDGSTDRYTPLIINYLVKNYQNVKAYFFKDGGSGSASRPRNKGFELSSSPYITYLDPDNEAVNDGYAKLLHEIEQDREIDMVVGNMIKADKKKILKLNYYKKAIKYFNEDNGIIKKPKEFLINIGLKPQSIQALVVKREIIEENNLKMVEKASGQDTMFYHELVACSKTIKVIDQDIHIYYGAVPGSVTNNLTKKIYEKYYILEQERIPKLLKYNLLDVYLEKRFVPYFTNWYLFRLPKIKEDHIEESMHILYKIYCLYKGCKIKRNDLLIKFEQYYLKGQYKEFVNEVVIPHLNAK